MNETNTFLDPSPTALNAQGHHFSKKYKFPFDKVPVGKSFQIQLTEVSSIHTLRTLATREGKRLGTKFRVINHGTVYEVFHQGGVLEVHE